MKIALRTSLLLLLATNADAFGAFGGGAKKAAGTKVVSKSKGKTAVAEPVKEKKGKVALKKNKKEDKKAGKKAEKKAPAKKVAAKKAPVKKAAPKKAAPKKAEPKTVVQATAKPPKPFLPGDDLRLEDMPGILPPVGLFDPLGFGARADANLLRKYREAELTHGRIAMIATFGFFTGEAVQGITPLFGGNVKGAGITQIGQVPAGFWITFAAFTFAIETDRVQRMIFDPSTCPPELKNRYRPDYIPGDIGFDPFGLKPRDPAEFKIKQTKELQNGRLAMLASSGFIAQELANKKGIVENVVGDVDIKALLKQLPLDQLPFDLPFDLSS